MEQIGSSYLEDDWKQELMTVNEFIDRYIDLPEGDTADHERVVGYLAQHHLFEQVHLFKKLGNFSEYQCSHGIQYP